MKNRSSAEGTGFWKRKSRTQILIIAAVAFLVLLVIGLIVGMATVAANGGKGSSNSAILDCNDACSTENTDLENSPAGFERKGMLATIYPFFANGSSLDVYCDCTDGQGKAWTVIQRRMDGSLNFSRDRLEYVTGFGDPSGEFWIGLDALSNFTAFLPYELRVDLGTSNETAYAEYKEFNVGNASTSYQLTVKKYSGTAGDSFAYHDGEIFLAKDDEFDGNGCASQHKGAWWYGFCIRAYLNGPYPVGKKEETTSGIVWVSWKYYGNSIISAEMKIRPKIDN